MIFRHLLNMPSHPTWVRGLKLLLIEHFLQLLKSHPTWVRGLKRNHIIRQCLSAMSHPTWVRGLKLSTNGRNTPRKGRTLRGCVD